MSTTPPFTFYTPAKIVDFPNDPQAQAQLAAQWHLNLTGFTEQGIVGNPWSASNQAGITNYFNPKTTPLPDTPATPIPWGAFPGRITFYFPQLSDTDVLSLADTGFQTNGQGFPPITQ